MTIGGLQPRLNWCTYDSCCTVYLHGHLTETILSLYNITVPVTVTFDKHISSACCVSFLQKYFLPCSCEMVIQTLLRSDICFLLFFSISVPLLFCGDYSDCLYATVHIAGLFVMLKAHLTCVQVFGSPSRKRKLPSDWASALWPHLHGLPRPAADEAAYGSVAEETQVSTLLSFSFLSKTVTFVCLPNSDLYSKCSVCLLHTFWLPLIAFLLKYLTIGLLTCCCFQLVDTGQFHYASAKMGLFTQWSMNQVQAFGMVSFPFCQSHKLCFFL